MRKFQKNQPWKSPATLFGGKYSEKDRVTLAMSKQYEVALKARLAERGLKVFLCDEAPGVNLKRTIFSAFSAADLAIIAASATYGRQTTSGFSTYEEMNFLQTEKKPYFLLKMTPSPNDKWEEVETRATYNMDVWEYWAPGAPMPGDLVDKIVAKLGSVHAAAAPAHSL